MAALADLIRSLRALDPQDVPAEAAIARTLGFELPTPAGFDSDRPREASGDTPSADTDDRRLLEPREREPRSAPPWAAVAPLARFDPGSHLALGPHRPLIDPRWSTDVWTTALGTALYRRLDASAAVARLASGQVLRIIPRERDRSLLRGVQVLADTSTRFEPFARDVRELTHELRSIVGARQTEVLAFCDAPLRGVMLDGIGEPVPYRAPRSGVPVLAITDLGLGGRRRWLDRGLEDEWLALARRLASRGCRLVVLVPFPPERWPRRLARRALLVAWDRTTVPSSVDAGLTRL
jgi:hypothetical protein